MSLFPLKSRDMAGDALSTHFSVYGVQLGSVSSASFVSTSNILQVQMRNIDNVLWFVLQHLTLQFEIHIGIQSFSSPEMNRICGVMVSMLTSSAVDCGFEPQSGQTNKDYKIGIC